MFTLVGHGEVADRAGSFANLAALSDSHISATGDDIDVPELNNLVAWAGGEASGGSGYIRVESPSLRRRHRFFGTPINGNADADAEPSDPQAVVDLRGNPIRLRTNEVIRALADGDPTTGEFGFSLYWLADGPIEPLAGADVFTVYGTGGATLSAGAWTEDTVTLQDELPVGRYAIVGLRPHSTGMVAARFTNLNHRWRPGALGVDLMTSQQHEMFRYGGLGVWGEIESTQNIQLEALGISADTDTAYWIDLVQIREGA